MIAASEPLEFVPHGRTVLAKHPTQIYSKNHGGSSEHSLLYKLTNFAIKDESILDSQEEDKEWWCVREVYARASDDFEDDSPQQKENNYMSESFRPPSRLKPDFNISIKSELMSGVKKMETDCGNSAGTSRGGSANSSSNMSKKFHLTDGQSRATHRQLNPKTDCVYEEELYVKGCTAVWSKGLISSPATKLSGPEHRETICCYTLESPIKHAAFANFHVSINNTMLIDALNSQIGDTKKNIKIEDTTEHLETKIMPSILLIDSKCMRVFATDGREYLTSIPFQVKKVWPMKYGVLLEKEATALLHNSFLPNSFVKLNESHNSSTFSRSRNYPMNMSAKLRAESLSGYDQDVPLPTCFSLAHPLDEVTPILMKSPAQGLQYYNDGDTQIIFVSTDPSIILLYDWKLGTHSLWKIRKAVRDECLAVCPNMNSTTTVFSQSDFIGSPVHSNVGKSNTNWVTGVSSPVQARKVGTPTFSRSRQNSPMATALYQQGLSPHASIGHASSASMLAHTITQAPPSLPLYPDICLDHIWTDTQCIRRDPIETPSDIKTFLHTDLVGDDYLCFMVKVGGVSRLQIVRLKKSHYRGQSTKTHLIVGSVSTVLAKDAVVLDHLKMIALIDESGNIILQTGNSVVGKVHVGGVLARLVEAAFGRAIPRRSSLLPTAAHAAFDDSLHLLSPVAPPRQAQHDALGLSALRDGTGSRVALVFEGGAVYRIQLPTAASSALVATCCDALKAILPKDIAMQVLIKWYGVRNAPGTRDLAPEQEWSMFANLVLALAGYHSARADDLIEPVEVATKKQRTSSDGTHEDWEYLLNSKLHKSIGNSLAAMLNLKPLSSQEIPTQERKDPKEIPPAPFNTNALLFPYIIQVLYAFHLVYEEIKLNTLLSGDLKPLAGFLYQIAKDLKLDAYVTHYWLDFPALLDLEYDESESQICPAVRKMVVEPGYFSATPPSIFAYIDAMLQDIDAGYYPHLNDINNMSRDIIEILCLAGFGRSAGAGAVTGDGLSASTPRARPPSAPPAHRALLAAVDKGITPSRISKLPAALNLLLVSVLGASKTAPGAAWPPAAYELALRPDLALARRGPAQAEALEELEKETAFTQLSPPSTEAVTARKDDGEASDGMEHLNTRLLSLLYPKDRRMCEVRRLLASSSPASILLTQRPEVSDHDFIEEQEKQLLALATRTMALPLARGMVTLRSVPCSPIEPLSVPKLCISGRGPPPRCNTITLSDTAPAQLAWPSFHNGAAAGLSLVPASGHHIHASWVLYNKPRGTAEMSTEHAGFLLALGLNGHLRDLPLMHTYEYLARCNEMTSVGLLLAIAATYRGTMDVQATKLMSVHLEPLLPATSVELELQQGVLAAALLGLGLLHQGSHHAHYARLLLREIGKPCGTEAEKCVERESYALAGGLALALVMAAAPPAARAPLAPALRRYMLAQPATVGSQKDKYKAGPYSGREGATVNLDVTAPGAIVALGLMYLRSGDACVASWLAVPRTHYLLDCVRPDLLMLRQISHGLIMWDSIEASEEWVESQVPDTIRPHCFVKPAEEHIDYEAMNQAYCNIVSGAVFALGLRFAGSGDEEARDAALAYARRLLAVGGRSVAALVGRSTLEAALCACLLAAAMIMAGRGDVAVLRMCRQLRARVPPAPHALSHAGQMAIHSCVGLLFLCGGRGSLSTAPCALGALLAAFFPKWPTHSEDNRYHLQAFRHLYVLAVEPRLILPRDLDTGKLCYANVQVVDLQGAVRQMRAPCILPELARLREVRLGAPHHWPVCFQRDKSWDQLQQYLEHTWCIDIKQRAAAEGEGAAPLEGGAGGALACLRHYLGEAKKDGICAECLVVSRKRSGGATGAAGVSRACRCRGEGGAGAGAGGGGARGLRAALAHTLRAADAEAAPPALALMQIVKSMGTAPRATHAWQLRLVRAQAEAAARRAAAHMPVDGAPPPPPHHPPAPLLQIVASTFDSWELKLQPYLRRYLGLPSSRRLAACDDLHQHMLAAYVVYYSLPRGHLRVDTDPELCMLGLEGNFSAEAASKIGELLR